MGSPPAPPLSSIWLSKYEPAIKDDAKLFERYMDDILKAIKESLIERLIATKLEIYIKGWNGKLPFLDICIDYHNNTLSST